MRQFHLTIAFAATIGLTSAAFADEKAKPRQGKVGNFRERLLKEFDADGDGKLNDEELAKARAAAAKLRGSAGATGRPDKAQLFKQFDKDGDGQLSEAERAAAREMMAKRVATRDGDAKDGDAKDGAARRPGRDGIQIPAELLKRFDTDGDGRLNEEERQAAMKVREEFLKQRGAAGPGQDFVNKEALIKRFDKNGDGKLDDGEQSAAREAMSKLRQGGSGEARKPRVDKKELLEKFDADGDGKLNEEERAKAVQEFRNRKKS